MTNQSRLPIIRGIVWDVVLNGLCPYLLFILVRPYTDEFTATLLSSLIPVFEFVRHLVGHRRMDAINVVFLLAWILGVVLALLGGTARLLLVRESLLMGLLGILALVSLVFPRPALFYLSRSFMAGSDAARIAAWNARWELPGFRRVMRNLTVIWGVGFLIESALRVYLVYQMATADFLALSPFIFYGTYFGLLLATFGYVRVVRRRAAAAGVMETPQPVMG